MQRRSRIFSDEHQPHCAAQTASCRPLKATQNTYIIIIDPKSITDLETVNWSVAIWCGHRFEEQVKIPMPDFELECKCSSRQTARQRKEIQSGGMKTSFDTSYLQ